MTFIAVVDDEESVRKALKRLLRAAGMEVDSYASGQEFLDGGQRPDCVVLDLHMPSMSGLQLLQRIHKMSKRLPVIVITAHEQAETRVVKQRHELSRHCNHDGRWPRHRVHVGLKQFGGCRLIIEIECRHHGPDGLDREAPAGHERDARQTRPR